MVLAAAAAAAFDSHPSDLVLVNAYLRPWVAQGVRAGAFVHAADLYSAEPADLARRFRPAVALDGERAWYFLSPLRTKSPRGRRKARTVAGGSGWWHGEAGPKPVLDPLDGRRRVGYRQSFSFMKRGDDGAPVRTGWIMVELRLHDDGNGGCGGIGVGVQLEGLVLCKVYRSPRHPAVAPEGEEEEISCEAAAPSGRHSDADDDHNSSSDALLAAAAFGGKRKADDQEGSSRASAPSPRRHIKKADGIEISAGAAAATAPGLKEKAADEENEISGATTAATPPGREEEKAANDHISSPARKRAKTADYEGAGAASARRRNAGGAPATQLHYCPQCGFHLSAFQVAVAPADAPAPQGGGRTGDLSGKDRSFHRFF